ncbi:MAG: hypothetical protein M1822_007328 [Bathelium mastoideum]|nr:MAG: hypothetical protein M1822_007328 [Bathelium mastoideum]
MSFVPKRLHPDDYVRTFTTGDKVAITIRKDGTREKAVLDIVDFDLKDGQWKYRLKYSKDSSGFYENVALISAGDASGAATAVSAIVLRDMANASPPGQLGHVIVNMPGNPSPAAALSTKGKWTPKRVCGKLSIGRTAQQRRGREHMQESRTRILDKKCIGYPRLATLQTSTPNFSLYRGFSYLHGRVLLDLQDEVTVLERELDRFDDEDKDGSFIQQRTLRSRKFDIRESERQWQVPGTRTRRDVLREIRAKLAEYDDVLIKARDIVSFQKPSPGDYDSVKRWIFDNKPLIAYGGEDEFINWKEDMVSLHQGGEWAVFDGLLIALLRRFNFDFIQDLFRTRELRKKAGGDHSVKLYTTERVETFVNLLITPVLCATLVLPIVAMYSLNISGARSAYRSAVVVLVVFTLLFTGAMPLFTKAGRNEIFAAAAAYCAVLVVFISNFSTSPHTNS